LGFFTNSEKRGGVRKTTNFPKGDGGAEKKKKKKTTGKNTTLQNWGTPFLLKTKWGGGTTKRGFQKKKAQIGGEKGGQKAAPWKRGKELPLWDRKKKNERALGGNTGKKLQKKKNAQKKTRVTPRKNRAKKQQIGTKGWGGSTQKGGSQKKWTKKKKKKTNL